MFCSAGGQAATRRPEQARKYDSFSLRLLLILGLRLRYRDNSVKGRREQLFALGAHRSLVTDY